MEPLVTFSGGERGRRKSSGALASQLPGASLWNKELIRGNGLKQQAPGRFGTRDQFHGRQFPGRLRPRGQTHDRLDPRSFREGCAQGVMPSPPGWPPTRPPTPGVCPQWWILTAVHTRSEGFSIHFAWTQLNP